MESVPNSRWGPLVSSRGARHRWAAVAIGSVCLAVGIPFCTRSSSEWESVYVEAAQNLRAGAGLYEPGTPYLYPPFMAWAATPFALLPRFVGRVAWCLINLGCAAAMIAWSRRLAECGDAHPGEPRAVGRLPGMTGLLCGLPFLFNCLAHQQTDIVIGALLVAGCLALRQQRVLIAATLIGLAAAMKCTPLLFAVWLAWRRRWRAAFWLVSVALVANLLPELTMPAPSGRTWLGAYAARYLTPLASGAIAPGTWGSDIICNQSISGAVQRWFGASGAGLLSAHQVRAFVIGVELFLLVGVVLNMGVTPRVSGRLHSSDHVSLECSAVLLLMLLLSPMSSPAHFGTLIVPGMCLAHRVSSTSSRVLWMFPAGGAVLALLHNKDLVGTRIYETALWSGCATWASILLLCGCCVTLAGMRVVKTVRQPAAESPSLTSEPARTATPQRFPSR